MPESKGISRLVFGPVGRTSPGPGANGRIALVPREGGKGFRLVAVDGGNSALSWDVDSFPEPSDRNAAPAPVSAIRNSDVDVFSGLKDILSTPGTRIFPAQIRKDGKTMDATIQDGRHNPTWRIPSAGDPAAKPSSMLPVGYFDPARNARVRPSRKEAADILTPMDLLLTPVAAPRGMHPGYSLAAGAATGAALGLGFNTFRRVADKIAGKKPKRKLLSDVIFGTLGGLALSGVGNFAVNQQRWADWNKKNTPALEHNRRQNWMPRIAGGIPGVAGYLDPEERISRERPIDPRPWSWRGEK